jgi:hypothetical protein
LKELLEKIPFTSIALGLVLVAACLLRIIPALTCQVIPDFSDMAAYNEAALAGGIPSFPPPGYPLFLRAIYTVFGELNYRAVFIIQALLSTVTVFFVYLVTRRIFSVGAGLIAAALAAVYPNLIAYNMTTLTETLSLFILGLLLLVITSRTSESRKSLIAGVLIFIGYVVKPAFLFFVPGALIGMKKRLPLLASLAVTFGSLMIYGLATGTGEGRGPIMLYKAYNRAAADKSYITMEETELGESDDVSGGDYLKETYDFVRSNKWMTFDIIYQKATLLIIRGWDDFVLKDIVGNHWIRLQLIIYGYIPVFLLGVAGLLRHYTRKSRIVALMVLSYAVFHIVVTIFKIRYRLPVEMLLIIFAGSTLASIRIGNPLRRPGRESLLGRLRSTSASAWCSLREGTVSAGRTVASSLRPDWDLLAVILVAAVALRIYFPVAMEVTQLDKGGAHLNELAVSGGIGPSHAPLYPLFLRLVYSIFGASNFRAVFIVQGLLNSMAVIIFYLTASKLWTRRAGILAAAIAAVYPRFFYYVVSISPVSLGIFLVLLLMLVLASDLPDRTRGIWAGIVAGSSVLLYPLLVFLVPGTLAVLKKSRWAFLITLVVLLTPMIIRNSAGEGRIVPVYAPAAYEIDLRKFENPRLVENRELDGKPAARTAVQRSRLPSIARLNDAVYHNMSAILGRDWRNNYDAEGDSRLRNFRYVNSYSYIVIMIIGIAGLFKYGRKWHFRVTLPVFCYLALLVFLTMMNDKVYARFPWEPVLIIYAAVLLCRQKLPGGDRSNAL